MNIWLLFCLDIQIDKIVSFDLIPWFAYPSRNNETAWSWLQIGVKNLLFEDRFFVQPIVQMAEKCCVKRLMKCGKRNWYLFENLYSGNLREGLSFVDTQGKTKTLVFMMSSSIIFGFKVSSWTLHNTTKTKP